MPVQITKRARFCAAHRLYNRAFSDEKNWEIFGPCANPNGHGHNYVLEVTVHGVPDPETGMVINFTQLSEIVTKEIIEQLDHKHLNLDVPWLEGVIPTLENLTLKIWERLDKALPDGKLHSIRLSESENNYAVYDGT